MRLDFLPEEVTRVYETLSHRQKEQAQELRFRKNRPVTVVYPWGEQVLDGGGTFILVTDRLLEDILSRATGFSPYSLRLEETGLYLPLPGGCRMGLCGETVMRDGKLSGLRKISSLTIRLARQKIGIARETGDRLVSGTQVASALIVSPPGGGKTTFLRDLIRCISEKGIRVSVIDERRELGAEGFLELGPTTDVLWGAPKAQAIPLMIRAMNPQVLAVDEICGQGELEEILYGAFSGVAVLATVHGTGMEDLYRRPLYRRLVTSGAFEWCITLEGQGKPRMERLIAHGQMDGRHICDLGLPDGGLGGKTGTAGAFATAPTATVGAGTDAGRIGTEYAAAGTAF